MTTSECQNSNHHEECQTVIDLKGKLDKMEERYRGNGWKIIAMVVTIVLSFGGCSSTTAMYYMSKAGDKLDQQRQLIDKNKDSIHKGESQYQKLYGEMSSLVAEMKEQREERKKLEELQREEAKEQREERKKLVAAVHRIEVIVVAKRQP